MEKGYLGIIADIKAGKGTIAEIISQALEPLGRSVHMINYSDPIRDCLLGLTHLRRDRDAYQKMSRGLREAFHQGILAEEIHFRAQDSSADLVVLAGMRRPDELPLVRSLPNSHVLYLTAPQAKRWEWLRAKNERPGDAEKTWEQFVAEDGAESEVMIRKVGLQADSRIDNSGTFEDLEHYVLLMLRDRFKYPVI